MRILFSFILLLVVFNVYAQTQLSEKKLKNHITFLASDKLQGRGTGTQAEINAANYIAKQFRKWKLTPKGNVESYFHFFSFKHNPNPHDTSTINAKVVDSRNVIAMLDNGAEYTIVIGAHYDHLGLGHDHNSLDPNPEGKIHNGADDNASGVSGLLELARYFAKNNLKENYNFLFIAFSGEELGLVGSKKIVESSLFDWKKVNCMINLDMIGRLNDTTKSIMIGGFGTSPSWKNVIEKNKADFKIKYDTSGIGPSDHTSFYLKDIPVLFLFTGQHTDYHKPSDDIEKINISGEKKLLELLVSIIGDIDRLPRLAFSKTKSNESKKTSFKVTLGIMPDYVYEGKGVRVDGVTDGKPAARAGLVQGDVIVQLGDYAILSIQDYMQALSKFKKNDITTLAVLRNGVRLEMPVTF